MKDADDDISEPLNSIVKEFIENYSTIMSKLLKNTNGNNEINNNKPAIVLYSFSIIYLNILYDIFRKCGNKMTFKDYLISHLEMVPNLVDIDILESYPERFKQ